MRGGAREGFVAHVPEQIDVKAIRLRMGLSQAKFANQFGFSVDAVRNWEQGRRQPDVAARAFLKCCGVPRFVEWYRTYHKV